MPSVSNYLNLLYVNLGFISQIAIMMFFRSALDIKENWPKYRCNPPYWIYSENISEDFTYCVQNTQLNMMGYLTQPLNFMIDSLASIGSSFNVNINKIREVISSVRKFVSDIVQNIFGVFLNIIIQFQKIMISIKDLVGKILGIVVTILYILDGSLKTMNSAWAGPAGQMVRKIGKIGSCFHPDTLISLKNGSKCAMKDLPLGTILSDNSKVFSVMKIDNIKKEKMYKIIDDEQIIYVTGDHYILDETDEWIKVKYYKNAILQTEVYSDWFSCLITTTGKIPIGNYIFWDWEDDCLNDEL
jgi:hypothetical protein